MRYIYGPVKSRRLGNSLGINMVPYKACPFDCVYCQLNKTETKTVKRRRYVEERAVLAELKGFWRRRPADMRIDCVTFSGSGEPTLHLGLGRLIREAKKVTGLPAVVLTNGALLTDPQVWRDLKDADIVVPSLDAVTQEVFEKIDQPLPGLRIGEIIEALVRFRETFAGALWVEVMLVRGLNDDAAYVEQIKKVIDRIRPEKIQLNSPVRPPAHRWVRPASRAALREACRILGPTCEII